MCLSVGLSVCMIQFSVVTWGCEGWCVCLLVWVCVYDSVLSGDMGLWGLMCLSVGLSVCMIQFSVVTWGCEGWCVCLLVWVCVWFSSQWWRGVVRVDVSVCRFECVCDSVLSCDVGLWGLMCLSVGLSVCKIQFSVVTWGCEGWCVCLLVWVCVRFSSQWWRGVVRVDVSVCWFECVYDSVLSGDVGLWGLMCLSVGLSVCMIQFSVVTWGCEGWCVCLLVWVCVWFSSQWWHGVVRVDVSVCWFECVYDSVLSGDMGLWGLMCLSVGLSVCMIQFSVVTWGCEGWCVCLLVWVCVWFSSQWWHGVVRVDVSVCWFECVYDSVLSGDMGLWGLMCLSVGLSVCMIQFSVVTWGCEGWCVCLLVWVCVWFSSQWWHGVVRVDVSVCWFECVCMIQFSVVTWGCEGWCVCLLVWVCVWFSSQWWRGVVRVDVSVCWFECVYDSVLSGDVGLWGLMCLSVGLSVCVIQFSVVTWGCEGWCVCLLVWVCV